MPRRSGARILTARSASLALASSILIALAALAPSGAAATRSETSTSPEAAAPAAPVPAAEPALTKAAERAAERQARRAERAAATSESQALAPSTTAAARAEARQAARAQKKAEHAAQREARRSGTTAPASAGAQSAAGVKADKTHAERTREHELVAEQRRREHEARSGRTRESKKQREAREAREAAGSEEGGELEKAVAGAGGSGHQAVPAGGVSSIEGGSPTAQPASTSAVASTRTGRAVRSTHARTRSHQARRSAATTGAGAATLGAGAALAAGGGEGGGTGAGGTTHAGRHQASSGKGESTIVRTVTQIVGVIPTALWLLIGVLGLAAMAFAIASRVASGRARRLDRQRRALLEDVGLLQAALLPELPERLGPVATSAAYRPASGPGAGGDFYDVFALPEGLLAVIVGDVSGHGREALPHTTLLRYTLRAYMEAGLAPREALRAAAPALERQLGGSFATVVLASWDPRARRLTYACAGHPHPIVSGLDPFKSIIAASAPPIGAGNATGSRQTVMAIPGAGTACFYTDGVIEARASGELYGPARLAAALASVRAEHAGTAAAASELLDRVAAETDRRPDDMAACLLELAGEEEEPRILSEQLVLDAHDAAGKRARRFLEAAGVTGRELDATLERARTIAAEHGSALLEIDLGGERPRVSVLQDNIAPLRARALARTQEVAL
jgi:hypothetical protein